MTTGRMQDDMLNGKEIEERVFQSGKKDGIDRYIFKVAYFKEIGEN